MDLGSFAGSDREPDQEILVFADEYYVTFPRGLEPLFSP
jgi:hypothetical protein